MSFEQQGNCAGMKEVESVEPDRGGIKRKRSESTSMSSHSSNSPIEQELGPGIAKLREEMIDLNRTTKAECVKSSFSVIQDLKGRISLMEQEKLETAKLREEIIDLQTDLKTTKAEIQEMKGEVKKNAKFLKDTDEEFKKLNEKVSKYCQDLEEGELKIDPALESLHTQMIEVRDKFDQLQDGFKTIKIDLAQTSTIKTKLENSLSRQNNSINDVVNSINDVAKSQKEFESSMAKNYIPTTTFVNYTLSIRKDHEKVKLDQESTKLSYLNLCKAQENTKLDTINLFKTHQQLKLDLDNCNKTLSELPDDGPILNELQTDVVRFKIDFNQVNCSNTSLQNTIKKELTSMKNVTIDLRERSELLALDMMQSQQRMQQRISNLALPAPSLPSPSQSPAPSSINNSSGTDHSLVKMESKVTTLEKKFLEFQKAGNNDQDHAKKLRDSYKIQFENFNLRLEAVEK